MAHSFTSCRVGFIHNRKRSVTAFRISCEASSIAPPSHLFARASIAEYAVNFSLGLEPIVQLEAIDVSALCIEVVRCLTDHPMTKVLVHLGLRAFGKTRLCFLLRFALRNGAHISR